MPGTGTVVAEPHASSPAERSHLLDKEVEQLAVEAKRLGTSLGEVTAALAAHWQRLERQDDSAGGASGKGDRKKK